MKTKKIVYWVATGLLSLLLCFSLYLYIGTTDAMIEQMGVFNYPSYLVYILAIAKAGALIAILSNIKGTIKEWAYAGLFFIFVLAFLAHYAAGDGEGAPPVVGMVFLAISYFTGKQVRPWIIRE